jgi:arylsulfatase A-like enzyme
VKNIILIITDTFRYDNLDSERARWVVRTPELERFTMERATSVEGCYVGSFPTIPHRTDLATGVLGWPHYGWQPIDVSGPNHIAKMLRNAGYLTQLICDCPHLVNARFQHGFDAAFQHRGQEGDISLLRMNHPLERVLPPEKTRCHPQFRGHHLADLHRWVNRYFECEEETFPAKTGSTTIRWLEENYKASPFFLWVDFFDPHEPWDAPEYLVKRYDPHYEGIPMIHPNYGLASAYTDAELYNLWAHYAAEAELVDRWIGRVLQKIDDLQLWEDSIVVVHSDHGISIGEHGRTGKSNISDDDPRYWPLYPELGHVPLMIAGGDVPKGERRPLLAQPIDLLPTICELASVEVKPPQPFDGRSFAGALLDGKDNHRDFVVSGCYIHAENGQPPRKASTPFLVTQRWGYAPVGARGRPELYDLSVDPLAESDIAADHGEIVKELHQLFLDYLTEHNAPTEWMALWREEGNAEPAESKWAID